MEKLRYSRLEITSASSSLRTWVRQMSRFGVSHGFRDTTVANAKTANPKIKTGRCTSGLLIERVAQFL
ncbi:hypothetical protein Pla52n_60770 [Stieleria varia]|uniref:Uncharacterized protein n=1 Tax=Stieleria varia TaxID=2528005 RepID=A0A5C5ZYK5_9BACT|nr:hypothetical protein Pla52n_60770 [Stieleria varia]